MNNKLKVTAATVGILGALAVGAVMVSADSTTTAQAAGGRPRLMSSIVTAISQRFGLNESDVQAVVDQQIALDRTQREAQMQQMLSDRLAQAVSAGQLTQTQSDAIKAKAAEVRTQIDALKDKTPQERDTAIKTIMDSARTWAEQNNIPLQFLMGLGMGKGHSGMMMGGFRGGRTWSETGLGSGPWAGMRAQQ